MRCQFIPGYLLERLATTDHAAATCGSRTREIDLQIRATRTSLSTSRPAQPALPLPTPVPGQTSTAAWEVYTARNEATLPGDLVRAAGQPESGDAAVDEAATGITASLALLADLGRSSYDDRGATVVATVHYEQDYDNAFWDGTQLVFGDGDGRVFDRFTKPIDVLGHELAHALTQYTANLEYADQPGALNESVSDVIGACVKQRVLGQDAAGADWLIGEGLFLPGINARALRSMAEPGTAYDDPAIGKDPQVGHMDAYVETAEDNGGVHINSGIPNKAFHLAATAIGGQSWAGAGRIWYAALTSGLASDTGFRGFADACVAAAGDHSDAVRQSWEQVGVLADADAPAPAPAPSAGEGAGGAGRSPGGRPLVVRRTGGYAGQVREGVVDLDADDDVAARARDLFDRADLTHAKASPPQPDRFVYTIACAPVTVQLGEPDLTPELAELVRLVLGATDR